MAPPTPSPSTPLGRHLGATAAIRAALVSAPPDTPPDALAATLHDLAHQHVPPTPLPPILAQATVDVLKGGIRVQPFPNPAFHTALRIVAVATALVHRAYAAEEPRRVRPSEMRARFQTPDRFPCTLLEYVFAFCTRAQLGDARAHILAALNAYRRAAPVSTATIFVIKAAKSCVSRDRHAANPILFGRLRLMLAAALPVWHVSGMNKRGQYNTGLRVDHGGGGGSGSSSSAAAPDAAGVPPVDTALYAAFWGAQDRMRHAAAAEVEHGWRAASADMDVVLSAFEALPCPPEPSPLAESPDPRCMTAPAILRLQLVDVRVRRQVLVQYAVFLHHLQVTGEASRPGAEGGKAEFCRALFAPEGAGEVMKARVGRLLEADSGGKFKRFLGTLLQREKRWIEWKKSGHRHLDSKGGQRAKVFKRRAVMSGGPAGQADVKRRKGASEWRKRQAAWKALPDARSMELLADESRSAVPTVEQLKQELREDRDDEDITEDLKRKNDTKYAWRSLRMLTEESLESVVKVIDPTAKTGYDLELCLEDDKKAEVAGEEPATTGTGASTNDAAQASSKDVSRAAEPAAAAN